MGRHVHTHNTMPGARGGTSAFAYEYAHMNGPEMCRCWGTGVGYAYDSWNETQHAFEPQRVALDTRTRVTAGDALHGEIPVPTVVLAEEGVGQTGRGLEDAHEVPFCDYAVVRRVGHGNGVLRR